MYQSLDPSKIKATLDTLSARIRERFPTSSLSRIANELSEMCDTTAASVRRISQPNYLMRGVVMLLIAVGVAVILTLVMEAVRLRSTTDLSGALQGVDAAMSLLIVFGGGAFFLSTLEDRWRQQEALKGLHKLRCVIHVIDMHQLTKDPAAFDAEPTASSPVREMSPAELLRYFGYSSELLSLTSKIAALYTDHIQDPKVIDAVGDIERLTSNLTQKIWQKIELTQQRITTKEISHLTHQLDPHGAVAQQTNQTSS